MPRPKKYVTVELFLDGEVYIDGERVNKEIEKLLVDTVNMYLEENHRLYRIVDLHKEHSFSEVL